MKPWRVKRFCIPAAKSPAFVHAMEDVLEVYQRPYDARFPQVCLDETSKQLLEHVRGPLPARPGAPRCVDDEYKRCGTANIFAAVEPLTGKVVTKVTERRTAIDFAEFLRDLAFDGFPSAVRIVLVMDNLSTHTLAALYEAFEAPLARRIAEKFELHFTPKHGSWLNMAELQLAVLQTQVLDQRIGTIHQLKAALSAWLRQHRSSPFQWRFTTERARIKLRRLYPDIQLRRRGAGGHARLLRLARGAAAERINSNERRH